MNQSTGVMRRPRRVRHRLPARHGGVLAAILAPIVVLAAACSGPPGSHVAQPGSTPTQPGSTATQGNPATQGNGALAFSACMRSNEVPNYPDPTSSEIPKETAQQLGVSTSQLQSAANACQHLLPDGGGPTQSYVQNLIARELRVARCMRAHGVTGFPDPGSDGHFPDAALHRAKLSPRYQAVQQGCWALGAP